MIRAAAATDMTIPALSQVVQRARDEAKAILNALEQSRHPQTNESSSLYLALVTLQKRLAAHGTAAKTAELAAELEQLAGLCTGKLAPVRPLVEQAAQLARGCRGQ